MHLPPHPTKKRSINIRKKRVIEDFQGGVVEEVSESQGGVVEELSDSQSDVVEYVSKSQVCLSEELTASQDYYRPGTITRQKRGTRSNMLNQTGKLNSEKIHRYLENIWLSFPEDKISSFTHLDPLWYNLYSDDSNREKVLNWIKKKDIFSRKYVFFPVVQWGHWSVMIFCHFGESLESKVKTPCILLLDSLEKADHSKQLEPLIRKFVLDIYMNLERTEDTILLRKMPFLVPKVPQQRDGEECGFFVLYYIKLFVESAPESFSISDGYPYFMKRDWFNSEGFDSFRKTLDTSDV
ncbi:ulp1 protease family catalytic domain, Homeodomain-like protein [Artemisia annua]|uniref:Ulp1 protease family catalytic domain, Homeodomain-like protein n=1 Tax=Artemisia annua TaxID=35608 RepID=A0A2U1NLM0_ARTAN|nr:ulp1 protease family catalytic domain, Homeodomain-like protein [Artemisia annua]